MVVGLALLVFADFSRSNAIAQSIEQKAQICAACHGAEGVPAAQAYPVPVIWGQNLGYLFFQLRDFKSGARKDDSMSAVAETLDPNDLMPLAQYFAKKAWPNFQQKPAAAEISIVAQRISASAACAACHQQGFMGDNAQPRLAGQVHEYLKKTMADFRSGSRANNAGMISTMKTMADHEIAALAGWLAGM